MDQAWNQDAENSHLTRVLSLVRNQLKQLRQEIHEQGNEITAVREELAKEEKQQLFQNLWSADSFENLALFSQQMHQISMQEDDYDAALKRIDVLKRMEDSPYFASMDLEFDAEDDQETVYLGRATLWDENKIDILIHDWRSPIASIFYRFGIGDAYYDAPMGRIECKILGKKQYEIHHGKMQYAFEADTAIQDAVLRRMLSQNASSQMRAIVETIQRDQDAAIRDETHDLVMVQGVAGSGKSSIALHRVAYLMYEGLKNRLSEQNILILSPNTLFEKYISSVLPELGERNVATATMEEILETLLKMPVQPRAERVDVLCAVSSQQRLEMQQALALKSSREFLQMLDRYLEGIPGQYLSYHDLAFAGKTIADKEEIKNAVFQRDRLFPLGTWLRRYEMGLWEQVRSIRPQRMKMLRWRALCASRGENCARAYAIYETGVLAREMRAMTRIDCHKLYWQFLQDQARLEACAEGIVLPENWRYLLSLSKKPENGDALALEDAAAIAYCQLKLYGSPGSGDIRQVVVDEAQDYGYLDFSLLNFLYPKARFTILGDRNQALEKQAEQILYDHIRQALNRSSAILMELTKSFRCTKEILEFSMGFLQDAAVESFNRSGEKPHILPMNDLRAEIARCRERGYKSIALIAKSMEEARQWHGEMQDVKVGLMGRDAIPGDVFIIPLALSKGLEFDAVLVLDCDESHYGPQDGQLLYVACTRALHHLTLFYQGTVSPLLGGKEKENGQRF